MQQMVKSEPLDRVAAAVPQAPLAFLDTNAILDYLRGEPAAVKLFAAEQEGGARFAINPIVAQELLLSTDDAVRPGLGPILERLKMLPVDFAKVEKLVLEAARALNAMPEAPALRKRLAHSNDFIILSSATECDFLVTKDARLKDLAADLKPAVVTPKEFIVRLRHA